MLVGAARQLERENLELKQENLRLREEAGTQRNVLEGERIDKSVLAERLRSEKGSKHLRNFGLSIGTTLALTGLLPNPIVARSYSWPLVVIGTLLLLISWFSPMKQGDQTPEKGKQE